MTNTTRKTVAIAIIIIFLFAALAGCFGDDEKPKVPIINLEEFSGTQSVSDWINQEGGGNPSSASAEIPLDLNSSMLTYVKVTVILDDYDAANAGSDEGSDPDEYTVKINSSGQESPFISGQTPGTAILELPAKNASTDSDGEAILFGPKITVMIEAVCNGGAGAFRPGNIVPPLIIKVDQGIAYTINVEYDYLDEPDTGS